MATPDAIVTFQAPPEEDDMTAGRDTRIEHLLEEWSLPYEFEPAYPVNKVRYEIEDTQIRKPEHRAPKQTVEEYVTHMRHGAQFPALVLTTNNQLVDGNTRLAAAFRLERKTFPVYKVKFANLGQARMIGAALNQMGGDRLTEAEIIIAAEAMLRSNYDDSAIARTLGRSVSHVRNVRKDQQFRDAAQRVGLDVTTVPKAYHRILANISHDEPFKAAAELVSRGKPAVKDVTALVGEVEKTRSDAEALRIVQTTGEQWGPVTGPPPGKRSQSGTRAKKALALVRQLLTLGDTFPTELVLPNDAKALEDWSRLASLADHVVAAAMPDGPTS